MPQKLLAIYIPDEDERLDVDRIIAEEFGELTCTTCDDGVTHHYHDLEVVGKDAVRHVTTFRQMSVALFKDLLRGHFASVQDSVFQFDSELNQLQRIAG